MINHPVTDQNSFILGRRSCYSTPIKYIEKSIQNVEDEMEGGSKLFIYLRAIQIYETGFNRKSTSKSSVEEKRKFISIFYSGTKN